MRLHSSSLALFSISSCSTLCRHTANSFLNSTAASVLPEKQKGWIQEPKTLGTKKFQLKT